MSVTVQYVVRCDGCGYTEIAGDASCLADAALSMARRGWVQRVEVVVGRTGCVSRDYCRKCQVKGTR